MLQCPRCQRAHPDEAAFCWFDGTALRDGTASKPAALPFDFVFPTGRRCRTFDELSAGCQEEWETACELLRQGALRQFLTGAGRLDLAKVADESAQDADADVSLATFLERLPGQRPLRAELDLEPRKLLVGSMPTGEKHRISLRAINRGTGLLHGTLQVVDDGSWLRLASGQTMARIKVRREETMELEIDTQGLPAGRKCAGRLTFVTNGGVVEVPVRLEVAARPFPHAPFSGVMSPRDLAVGMRNHPKAAVPLLESGEVTRWFAANGWACPIVGKQALGVAAVQQFFEGLGLAKVPTVRLAEPEVRIASAKAKVLAGHAVLTTADRKWIYAEAESETPWLRVTTPQAGGSEQATVDYQIESRGLTPGQTHQGKVRIRANGNQQLLMSVFLAVPQKKRSTAARIVGALLVGAAVGLVLRLLMLGPADLVGFEAGTPDYLRLCVGAGGAVGALAGLAALARLQCRWTDRSCGMIAGAWLGAALGGTLACLAPLIEGLLPIRSGHTAGLLTAALVWAALGALLAGCGLRRSAGS